MKRCMTLAALATGLIGSAFAQVNYTGGTYTQDFNTLSAGPPSNTAITWTDNSTLLGWYGFSTGAELTAYRAGTGSSNAGAVYSFGEAEGNTERALGSVSSGTPTTIRYAARFTNSSASAFDLFSLQYIGEQWRNGGNTTPQSLTFEYSTDATSISTGTWTAVSGLDFTSPIATATAAALNGNLAENRVAISQNVSLSSNWTAGTDLWIRWTDLNDAGNDHGLAIDNLSFTARPVPEPATLAALGLGAMALIRRKRK